MPSNNIEINKQASPQARLSTSNKIEKNRAFIPFILPGFLIYAIFFVLPTIAALALSFTNWDGISSTYQFVGIDNYQRLFTDDPIFKTSIFNNLKFMITVLIVQTCVSLFFAMMLMKNSKMNIVYRTIFFLPTILASVSIAFIWIFMYDPNMGALNQTLQSIGLESFAQSWLGDRKVAIFSIAFVQVWAHIGQMTIIFVAGLHSLPKEVLEAAEVDGASRWQRFRHVTLPLLAPSLIIVTVYTMIQSFKAFDLIIAMTDGGPSHGTEILSTLVYHEAFGNFHFGYASAIAVVFMIIIALLTVLQFKLINQSSGSE
ncbi:carbohydrate ABC transporter permease [Priestia koreensis]|uniref:carbohydrate ABC transporter permease n=1 Tax=Priestia koreensis TaxID=284581 RepID=UPI003F534BB8